MGCLTKMRDDYFFELERKVKDPVRKRDNLGQLG